MIAWVRVLEVFNTLELAALLMPQRDRVMPPAETTSSHEDRRLRRRTRDLVKRMEGMSADKARRVRAPLP